MSYFDSLLFTFKNISRTVSAFDGQQNPILIENWISEVEFIIKLYQKCQLRFERMDIAKSYLVGSAQAWYNRWNPRNEQRNWDVFLKVFKKQFYPPGYSIMMNYAFENIEHKNSVYDYNLRFFNILNQSFYISYKEEALINHYKKKLPATLTIHLNKNTYQTLSDIMTAAIIWERDFSYKGLNNSVSKSQEVVDPMNQKV